MSRSMTARVARNLPKWLLLVLFTTLLAWRIDSRIEQYHPSGLGTRGAVAFFDANERNTATLEETHFKAGARGVAEHPLLLLDAGLPGSAAAPSTESHRRRPERPPVLSRTSVHPVSLFPNPPPASLA